MPTDPPKRPVARAIFHRDGSITYYSVFSGQWQYHVRPEDIPESHFHTLKPDAQERIMKRLAQHE